MELTRIDGFALLAGGQGGERPFVPSGLAGRLFGAPVVALMDAGRTVNLAERLEASGLEHLCLFTGDLGDHAEAAPWLVRLDPEHDLTRALFTLSDPVSPSDLWPAAPLMIETGLGLEALRRHLRRFLRVESEDGAKFWFFRFWEPIVAPHYFAGIGDRPDLVARWFRPREGGRIERLVIADTGSAAPALWQVAPVGLGDEPAVPRGAFRLTAADHATMHRARTEHDLARLAGLLIETFPEELSALPRAEIDRLTRRTVSRMRDYGFAQRDYLFQLLAWDLFLGPDFELRDAELTRLCRAGLPEGEKFAAVAERVMAMG